MGLGGAAVPALSAGGRQRTAAAADGLFVQAEQESCY